MQWGAQKVLPVHTGCTPRTRGMTGRLCMAAQPLEALRDAVVRASPAKALLLSCCTNSLRSCDPMGFGANTPAPITQSSECCFPIYACWRFCLAKLGDGRSRGFNSRLGFLLFADLLSALQALPEPLRATPHQTAPVSPVMLSTPSFHLDHAAVLLLDLPAELQSDRSTRNGDSAVLHQSHPLPRPCETRPRRRVCRARCA